MWPVRSESAIVFNGGAAENDGYGDWVGHCVPIHQRPGPSGIVDRAGKRVGLEKITIADQPSLS